MLERRRRSQLRLEPLVSVPARTTMTRRTRRVTFNIEANGPVSPRGPRRRRRRELLNPYAMHMPMMYNPMQAVNPWNFNPNNIVNGGNFMDRLTAGDFEGNYPFGGLDSFDMYSGESFEPPPQEPPIRSFKKNSGQQAIDDLKDILYGLETHLAAEKLRISEENSADMESEKETREDHKPPQDSQISVLTEFMSETVEKLNNYLTHHSQEQVLPNNHMDRMVAPPVLPPMMPPYILQLPIQPVIIHNADFLNSSNLNQSASDLEPSSMKRPYLERLPWLRKPRRRPPKTTDNVRTQNKGSSTDDLETLPKILEATKSKKMCNTFGTACQTCRDEGTTMWCPMECCRKCCGVVKSLDVIPIVKKMLPPNDPPKLDTFNPPPVEAPPPSQLSSEEEAEVEYPIKSSKKVLYRPASGSIYVAGTPPNSSLLTTCDCPSGGGNLTYSYVEEEEEEHQEENQSEDSIDEDDWSNNSRKELSEWEKEQQYHLQMEMTRRSQSTKNKRIQTDPSISDDSSSVEIIATTDKALSTSDINNKGRVKKPVLIFSVCKRSSIRRPYRMKSGHQSRANKVQFEKILQTEGVQVGPEMRSFGTNPIRLRSKESSSKKNQNPRKSSTSSD
ncbi:hypothetical protein KR026_012340, partial [Drosophila bipectinata]